MAKSILITGASDGIGFEIARQALDQGYAVHMLARDETRIREAVESLPQERRPRFASIDLTNEKQRRNYMIGMEEAEFVPDVLVNNAGVGINAKFDVTTEEELDAMTNIHFKGPYFITQKLLPLLNDGSSIVNTSSFAATSNWQFGDGGISNIYNPVYSYLNIGNYLITLTINAGLTCSATITKSIEILNGPIAKFTFTTSVCDGRVDFSNISINGVGSYW